MFQKKRAELLVIDQLGDVDDRRSGAIFVHLSSPLKLPKLQATARLLCVFARASDSQSLRTRKLDVSSHQSADLN